MVKKGAGSTGVVSGAMVRFLSPRTGNWNTGRVLLVGDLVDGDTIDGDKVKVKCLRGPVFLVNIDDVRVIG